MQLRRRIRKQCGDRIRLDDDFRGARANDEPSFVVRKYLRELTS